MKKIFIYLTTAIISLSSCENLLETNYDGSVKDEMVWSNPTYAEGVLLNAYNAMPNNFALENGVFMDCATDNAVTNHYTSSIYKQANGGWRAESNTMGDWYAWYEQIEYINLWLKYGQSTPYYLSDETMNQRIVDRLKGEAYFLRAWYTWQLLQAYSGKVNGEIMGVPLFTEPVENNEELLNNIKRASYLDCVNQISADCDMAVNYLPDTYTGDDLVEGEEHIGRANALSALALKSRLYLYAASPAFGVKTWNEAAEIAASALDAVGLTDASQKLPTVKWNNLDKYYGEPKHSELLLRKFTRNNTFFRQNIPPITNGEGRTSPSQDLVECFYTANGYPITRDESGYDVANPYANMSNRFKATIIYNQAKFQGKTINTYEGGFDTEATQRESTRTGYYVRKWMSDKANTDEIGTTLGTHYYAPFRQTELLLNFAEAVNETVGSDVPFVFGGVSMTAKEAIAMIHQKVGITETTYIDEKALEGSDAFREVIHNERRIELCFEGHRFWDLRRLNQSLNTSVRGVKIIKTGTVKEDEEEIDTYSYSYPVIEERAYSNFMNYAPIPYDEVVKGLEQNDGWR